MTSGSSILSRRLRTLACLALAAATAAVLFARMFRGVDFTDESFHAALAYRFVLGDVPFRDELAVHQSAALVTLPAVWLFDRVERTPDGLVLYLRFLYLAFVLGLGALVWAALRRLLGDFGAIVAAALFLVAYPASDLNYNTLGSGLVTASLCLTLLGGPSPRRGRLVAGGIAAGIAIVAYPPLLLWLLAFLVLLWAALSRSRRVSGILEFAAGAAVVLVPFGAFLLSIGPRRVLDSIVLTNETAKKLGGFRRFLSVGYFLLLRLPIASALVAVVFALAFRRRPRVAALRAPAVLFALVAACLGVTSRKHLLALPAWPDLVVSLAVLAPLLLLMLDDAPAVRKMLAFWAGAAAAGFLMAYFTTSNREHFGRSGALIPLVAAGWLAARGGWRAPRPIVRLSAGALGVVLVLLVAAALVRSRRQVYRDRPTQDLAYLVPDGPFAGIRTSRRRFELIRALQADLTTRVGREDFVVFYDDFPAGFLMSRRRPGVCGVWVYTRPGDAAFRRIYADCVSRMARTPLTAIRLAVDPRDPGLEPVPERPDDPLQRLVARCGRPVVRRELFEVFRLDPECQRGENPAGEGQDGGRTTASGSRSGSGAGVAAPS